MHAAASFPFDLFASAMTQLVDDVKNVKNGVT